MSDLERTNLAAHVDLCQERYKALQTEVTRIGDRLDNIEAQVNQIREDNRNAHNSNRTVLFGGIATVVAGILSVIVVLLMK